MKKFFLFIGRLFYWLWKFLTTGCLIFTNLIVLATILFILSFFFQPEIKVPDGSALIIDPTGDIVEKSTAISPYSRILNGFAGMPVPGETLLQDIIDAIETAANDDRIKLIILDQSKLESGSLDQLDAIGRALAAFQQAGKKVIAVDDQYSQSQYYLATYADEIFLNPMGSVDLRGFSVFRLYLKELIDKLAINFHIFRVGTFKSAIEPFSRNDMSEDAKMANRLWLNNVWDFYCRQIAGRRNLKAEFFNTFINEMPQYLRRAGGSMSEMALTANLVDAVKTRDEIHSYITDIVGKSRDGKTFKNVHLTDYLYNVPLSFTEKKAGSDQIGLIVAQGNILYGQKVPGQISSEHLCSLIREARNDKNIKALVLRIDSGGGSALASELIRRELLLLKESGKPLVVSMGSMAASGAYWISAPADRIIAAPSTLTGSIGIFGLIPTFEESIAKIGMHSDGIATTDMAGAGNLTVPLPEEARQTIQLSIEDGYDRFLHIVSEGRNMPIAQVEKIAEGRVWDGMTAMELGLIDEHGYLDDAISAAADLAGLEEYSTVYIEEPGVRGNRFLRQFRMEAFLLLQRYNLIYSPVRPILAALEKEFDYSVLSNDPAGIYAHSLLPASALRF